MALQKYGVAADQYAAKLAETTVDNTVSMLMRARKSILSTLSDHASATSYNDVGGALTNQKKAFILSIVNDAGYKITPVSKTDFDSGKVDKATSIYYNPFNTKCYLDEAMKIQGIDIYDAPDNLVFVEYFYEDTTDYWGVAAFGTKVEGNHVLKPFITAIYALTYYTKSTHTILSSVITDLASAVTDFKAADVSMDTDFAMGEPSVSTLYTNINTLYTAITTLLSTTTTKIGLDDVEVADRVIGNIAAVVQEINALANTIGNAASIAQGVGGLQGQKWQNTIASLGGVMQSALAQLKPYQDRLVMINQDIKDILEIL